MQGFAGCMAVFGGGALAGFAAQKEVAQRGGPRKGQCERG